MNTQSVLVLAGIVSAFVFFGVVLAWADFYTQRRPKSGSEAPSAAKDNSATMPDERRAA